MIKKVVAKNFLSWKALEFNLSAGVTLIDGWNEDDQTPEGSGKSAILNAIAWGLYGKIPKDANIDDVIKEGEKSCEVEVWFTDETVIRRTRKPNELVMLKYDSAGWVNVKGKDAKETQAMIDDFVALSFETFCQTIYFAQNYTKKFITSNQEEKGKILSEVQDLIIFDKAGKEVRSLIKLDEDALTKLKHSKEMALKDEELAKRDIASQEMQYEHARQQQVQRIKNLETQLASQEMLHKSAYEQQVTRIANLNVQIMEVEKAIREQEASRNELLQATNTMVYDEPSEKAFQEANNQLIARAAVLNSEIAGINQLVAKRSTAEAQGKRYAARYKQLQVEKEKNLAFIANPSKNCPTCGTQLEACDTSHAQTDVTRIDQEIVEITDALTMLSAEIDAPIPTKEDLTKQLTEIGQDRMSNDVRIQEIRSVKDKLTRAAAHLNAFEQNIKAQTERLNKLRTSIDFESQPLILDMAPVEALRSKILVESLPLVLDTAPLEALKIKLHNIQSNSEDLTRLAGEKQKHLHRLEDLKNGFKEIKSFVFNSMLNEINGRIQKYLSHLFEVPVSVRFRNEDMKIETDVKFDGVDRGLGLLSGGQFRRVSLAVDLALSDAITARKGSRLGVLILDEYFKDLSESSMEKCLTLLEGRGQPVLLIEHNSIFKNIVNSSVSVRLENGTSSVQV